MKTLILIVGLVLVGCSKEPAPVAHNHYYASDISYYDSMVTYRDTADSYQYQYQYLLNNFNNLNESYQLLAAQLDSCVNGK